MTVRSLSKWNGTEDDHTTQKKINFLRLPGVTVGHGHAELY